MKDNVLFLNMFALYEPEQEFRELLKDAVIRGAELDPVQRIIELELYTPAPIPGSRIAPATPSGHRPSPPPGRSVPAWCPGSARG